MDRKIVQGGSEDDWDETLMEQQRPGNGSEGDFG